MSRNLWQAAWAWVICFVVTVAISLATEPKPAAELRGLVRGLTSEAAIARVALWRRPAFWAGLSFVVLVALNVYFW
jgi:SSS family solute:Na+ symporter